MFPSTVVGMTRCMRTISSFVLFIGISSDLVLGQTPCAIPSALQGSWLRASDSKILSFNSSLVANHVLTDQGTNQYSSFSCQQSSGDKYVMGDIKTEHEDPLNTLEKFYVHFCWQLIQLSESTFLLFQLTPLTTRNDGSFQVQRVYKQNSTDSPPLLSQICSLDNTTEPPTILFKVPSGANDLDPSAIAAVRKTCPADVFATYSYVKDVSGCQGTASELDFCVDRMTARVNYTLCPTEILYSQGGLLSCLYSFTLSNVLYILLANHDPEASVDKSNHFRFACMEFNSTTSGSTKTETATIYPGECSGSKKHSLALTRKISCVPDDSSKLDIVPIIAGVVAGVVVIALIVVIVVLVVKLKAHRERLVTPSTVGTPEGESPLQTEDNNPASPPQGQLPPLPPIDGKPAPGPPLRS